MDFEELSNPWSHYKLPDGRTMRVRHILTDVLQTGTDPDGLPMYHLNFGAMVHIEPTEGQKLALIEQARKAQEQQTEASASPKGTILQ